MENIAILGLSGDPPHLGHFAVAMAVRAAGYERVWFMITPQNPFKTHVAMPYWHRRELARLLTRGQEDWLEICDFEAGVSVNDPDFRTFTVLTALKLCMPGTAFTFVMGADTWAHPTKGFHTWKNYELIPERAGLLILPREPWTDQLLTCAAAEKLAPYRYTGEGPVPTGMWRALDEEVRHAATSTEIRDDLKAGRDSEHLTPAQNAYAKEHGLYR